LINLDNYKVAKVGRNAAIAKEFVHAQGEAEIVVTLNARKYIVNVEQTQFFRANGGKIQQLRNTTGSKSLLPGLKIDIKGRMDPGTGYVRATSLTIL
jgi:hypothetical protein